MHRMRFLSLLLLLQVLVPKTCHGWGTIGHEVVANVAWAGLSPEAQLWVTNILSTNSSKSTSSDAAIHNDGLDHIKSDHTKNVVTAVTAIEDEENSPLGMVADWADQVRQYLPWSAALHYIDVRDDLLAHGCHVDPSLNPQCRFLYERDCPNDTCVAGAIVNYTQQLSPSSTPAQRLLRGISTTTTGVDSSSSETPQPSTKATKEALMFLSHFIGDIHQPLHCSRLTDKGGNDIHVQFHLHSSPTSLRSVHRRDDAARQSHPHHGWNLHSVWDSGLIEVALGRDYNNSRRLLEQHLIQQLDVAKHKYLNDCDPALGANRTCTIQWGQESWDVAVRYAYTMSNNNRTDVMDGSTLDEDYYQTRWPLAMDRLLAGAVRLAGTLEWLVQQNNQTIGSTEQTPMTASVHNVLSPSLLVWSTLFSNPWSWTSKAGMLYG